MITVCPIFDLVDFVLRQEAQARCQGCGADGVKEGYCVTEVSSGNHSPGVKKLFKATPLCYIIFSLSCTELHFVTQSFYTTR